MAQAPQKITLSTARDIPFNKLVLSQCNVRRIKAGVSIEELAEDIARRTLLQGLTVRPVLDADGAETGMYEIPAGGRRYRALALLVKQKRLAKTAPVPCVIRTEGIAEEDSLAENVQRAPLHPLDQFRAFLALRERGLSEEEIAAAFFIGVPVVRQRLRLASVSPKLLDIYAEDGLTLDQLMAFTVSGDHERQEQVFERLRQSGLRDPYVIRRMLTEDAVRAADKRARFVGIAAYEAAGGVLLRDLFQGDDGGWLQDVALLDRLVAAKLEQEAEAVREEGWKWIEVAPDFPYGHSFGLRQLRGEPAPFTAEEQAACDALRAEYDRLDASCAEADEVPEAVDARLSEIETALAGFEDRPVTFDPAEMTRAGAFVSIDGAGALRVERGFIRPEDELPIAPEPEPEPDAEPDLEARGRRAGRDGGARRERRRHDAGRAGDGVRAGGRGDGADPRAADDRTHRAPDARAAARARRAAGGRLAGGAARPLPQGVLSLRPGFLPRARPQERRLRRPGAGAERHRAGAGARRPAPGLGHGAAEGAGRSVGRAGRVRRRPPAGAVRALRRAERQRAAGVLEPAAAGAGACRPSRPSRAARHGGGRLGAKRRTLSRPGDQGAHPRRGARGQRRSRRRSASRR